MPRKVIYLSGKMRGLPDFGFSLFDAGKKLLTAKGWRVISPADMDRASGFTPDLSAEGYDFDINAAFERDFQAILDSHAMALLPNWHDSTGAHAELVVAQWTGRPLYYVDLEKEEVFPVTIKRANRAHFHIVDENGKEV